MSKNKQVRFTRDIVADIVKKCQLNLKEYKQIGSGRYGSIFLIYKYDKPYAYRIQKCTKSDMNPKKDTGISRSLEFYNIIKMMPYEDKRFFNELHEARFITMCKHKQDSYSTVNKHQHKELYKLLDKMKKSKICFVTISDYIPGSNLFIYLGDYYVDTKTLHSILLQIYKIYEIMQSVMYAHGDLSTSNLMITHTYEKSFKIDNSQTVAFDQWMIKLIDYEFTYSIKKFPPSMRKYIGFAEIYLVILDILDNNAMLLRHNPGLDLSHAVIVYMHDKMPNVYKQMLKDNNNVKNSFISYYKTGDLTEFFEPVIITIKNALSKFKFKYLQKCYKDIGIDKYYAPLISEKDLYKFHKISKASKTKRKKKILDFISKVQVVL